MAKPKPKAKPTPRSKVKPKAKPKSKDTTAKAKKSEESWWIVAFKKKDPRTPVKGFIPRLKNTILMHYRGVLGVLIPIWFLTWQGEKGVHHKTVQAMWILMAWFFVMQPVTPPVTATIPIFLLPMAGVLSTVDVCACYMTENILLFILCGMLLLLLNNSGVDRRIALSILCSGKSGQFTGRRLIFKCATASFLLSMFSNRLIVSSTITQYLTKPLMDLQTATSKYRGTEPNYDTMRNIINNAIQTSASIGSIAILHSSTAVLCFRSMWCESAPKGLEFPDIFNYIQYSSFAFPVALIMFILNFSYHMLLLTWCSGKPMSSNSKEEMHKALLKYKSTLPPKVTLHEKLTLFFLFVTLLLFFLRWSRYLNMGWANFSAEESSPTIPGLKDASVAAMMVIVLHIMPRGYGFLSYVTAKKKSQLPPLRPASSVLWWKFVDKNTNYGYIFMLGGGIALVIALRDSGLGTILGNNFGKKMSDHPWNISLLLVCMFAMILPNLMTGVAACVVLLPFVLNLVELLDEPVFRSDIGAWALKSYLGALGVGIGTSLGFMRPFKFTPAYFCFEIGKVPQLKMALYSLGSTVICFIILWLSLAFYAPILWDPNNQGIVAVKAPIAAVAVATTAGPADAPPAP
ncbi:hypothetical protein K1T71_007152 [Dendrolimus kikuchii]|uniref:Uncharacterized protein n=1 Tax=Dendrolimus kikuchii TaxID=765133 RepID=A0ACC1CZN5_9NEOP|nr:hypothetical protein K1T71_007152 [Dendrolimus kikuchii]